MANRIVIGLLIAAGAVAAWSDSPEPVHLDPAPPVVLSTTFLGEPSGFPVSAVATFYPVEFPVQTDSTTAASTIAVGSSTLADERDRYVAAGALDGDPLTSWVEGAAGHMINL